MGLGVQEKLAALRSMKEDILQDIIDDKSLSIKNKIEQICEHKLLPLAPFMQHEFLEWEQELDEQVKAVKGYSITDSFIDPSKEIFERYQSIEYTDVLYILDCWEDYFGDEDGEDDEEKVNDGLITVITARGSSLEIRKTKDEVIEKIYEHMIKEKIRGFMMDW